MSTSIMIHVVEEAKKIEGKFINTKEASCGEPYVTLRLEADGSDTIFFFRTEQGLEELEKFIKEAQKAKRKMKKAINAEKDEDMSPTPACHLWCERCDNTNVPIKGYRMIGEDIVCEECFEKHEAETKV